MFAVCVVLLRCLNNYELRFLIPDLHLDTGANGTCAYDCWKKPTAIKLIVRWC